MSVVIEIGFDCPHCGSFASVRSLDTTNPQPDGSIRIDAELLVACTAFYCGKCQCSFYTGDLQYDNDDNVCGMNEDDDDDD